MNNRFSWRILTGILLSLQLLFVGNGPATAQPDDTKRETLKSRPPGKTLISLENPKREQFLQPDKVLDVFGVKKGESVADVGAGTGFFTFRMAGRVGDKGRVYAVEIQDEMLNFIRKKTAENGITNIIPVKSSKLDPALPPASCDKILVVNTYNYISDPVTFMRNLRRALKPGGLMAIIDTDLAKVKTKKKLAGAGDVIEEMKRAGFVLRDSHDFITRKYFMVFSAAE